MDREEKLNALALSMVPGLGDVLIKNLISYCGNPTKIFQTSKGKLLKIPGIGEKTAMAIMNKASMQAAEKELAELEKAKVSLLFYTGAEYPKNLKQISDAPIMLYYKGSADLNNKKILSIVGTRNATAYGKEVVQQMIKDLKGRDVLIVSGLAYGIDIAVHKACLESGIETIGVLGSGIDNIYPSLHKNTAMQMIEKGGLMSEQKLGTKPEAHHFPARNRIVAGMADAVIVIEAANKGGALITAEIANSYDKDVFAVPGNVGSKYSEGCNELIKQNKASLITTINDLELILDLNNKKPQNSISVNWSEMSVDENKILNILKENKELQMDDISWKTQIAINQTASILLNLEFKGLVKSLPGKKYLLRQ